MSDKPSVLFVCVLLCHHRRRIVHLNITPHPTAEWSAQQVVDAFPDDTAPRWLSPTSDKMFYTRLSRDQKRFDVVEGRYYALLKGLVRRAQTGKR